MITVIVSIRVFFLEEQTGICFSFLFHQPTEKIFLKTFEILLRECCVERRESALPLGSNSTGPTDLSSPVYLIERIDRCSRTEVTHKECSSDFRLVDKSL